MAEGATFPITARYAYPDNGWAADRATAAEHLEPGEVYQISRMEVSGFRTVLYLLDFPGVEFNAIQFAPPHGGSSA